MIAMKQHTTPEQAAIDITMMSQAKVSFERKGQASELRTLGHSPTRGDHKLVFKAISAE